MIHKAPSSAGTSSWLPKTCSWHCC